MHSPDDETLVELTKRGNQRAYAQLVERHQGFVYSLCYSMAGRQEEAEDLAQEAFVRLYRSLDRFRSGAELRPWLRRITTNVCLDALRRRGDASLPLDEVLGSSAEPRSHSTDELPEEAALADEARRDVRDLLLALPVDYRVVLVLRYLEDLSYREIAEALAVPVSTVETRIYRAKRSLARALSPPVRDRGYGPTDVDQDHDQSEPQGLVPRKEVSRHGLHVEGRGIV